MARISGKTGKLLLGATQLHITEWSLDDMVDTPESTDSESNGWKTRIVGQADFNGSFSGFWDDTTSPMTQGFTPGTAGTIKCYVNATAFYSGPVLIAKLSPSVPIKTGDPVEFKGEFVGNGALTRPA